MKAIPVPCGSAHGIAEGGQAEDLSASRSGRARGSVGGSRSGGDRPAAGAGPLGQGTRSFTCAMVGAGSSVAGVSERLVISASRTRRSAPSRTTRADEVRRLQPLGGTSASASFFLPERSSPGSARPPSRRRGAGDVVVDSCPGRRCPRRTGRRWAGEVRPRLRLRALADGDHAAALTSSGPSRPSAWPSGRERVIPQGAPSRGGRGRDQPSAISAACWTLFGPRAAM